jgi:hypothetical protein
VWDSKKFTKYCSVLFAIYYYSKTQVGLLGKSYLFISEHGPLLANLAEIVRLSPCSITNFVETLRKLREKMKGRGETEPRPDHHDWYGSSVQTTFEFEIEPRPFGLLLVVQSFRIFLAGGQFWRF